MGFCLGTQVFPGGRVLTLASARASDSGSYSCVAVSTAGEDRREIILHVHGESQAGQAVWCGPAAREGGPADVPNISGRGGNGWVQETLARGCSCLQRGSRLG